MGTRQEFVDLKCPTCGQEIRVWHGIEATCTRNGLHKRVKMKPVMTKPGAELEGQESLTGEGFTRDG